MIPWEWDDGFTVELDHGIRVRPMLLEQRVQALTKPDLKQIFNAPWYWGPEPETLSSTIRCEVTKRIISSQVEENQQFREVDESLEMLFKHANLLRLSCESCRKYATDHESGTVYYQLDGSPTPRSSLIPLPCETLRGCPKGHWKDPKAPTRLGLAVWSHFWKYDGPQKCPLMARNAALINWVVKYGRRPEYNPFSRRAATGPA